MRENSPSARFVDLHLHTIASDGDYTAEQVVQLAVSCGLSAIALTDHDTLAGVPAAQAAGKPVGLQVVSGCEFSVQASWGEMHVIGYFLPLGWVPLERFLQDCRADRQRRGGVIVERLNALGVVISLADLTAEAQGGAVGRPHVAKALVKVGAVRTIQEAFDRYLGWGRPAFAAKQLPSFRQVAELVHAAGGVVSAAHLRDRASRTSLAALKAEGLDAVETRHPVHDPDQRARLTDLARELDLLVSGGSDWHGPDPAQPPSAQLGGQQIPGEWLDALSAARPAPREPMATAGA